ncbi:MAG: heme ABC exporter ATP-binding protein CcmA [Acidimicrobiales bacterium]|nr:heme ABC exporter ATP-binding protein CcmA [Acidimicrobiales bacterium]MBO0893741.1 heme ABC exporter ATP-binding protein CcmA [Acidimicrobiales bacterium]
MAPAVRLRSAIALFGRFPALAGVDLDVEPGEVVLLEGPNGAGKTSVLRVCAGLLTLTSGEAEVLGHDLRQDRRSVRRQLGMVGHATFLYDDLTVAENVRFAVRAAGGDGRRVAVGLERLGLDGPLQRHAVGRLSAGQRRRVALAVLVARSPLLWLLDEPHAGLDAASRDVVDETVAEAVRDGATVLMASHERDRAEPLASRVVTMGGGRVLPERGPAKEQSAKREQTAAEEQGAGERRPVHVA